MNTGQSLWIRPDLELAGHIGGGEDPDNARDGPGRFRVDLDDVGPGVIGQTKGAVQHPVDREIVDEAAIAQGQLGAFVLGAFLADPTRAGPGRGWAPPRRATRWRR